jgi:proline iminopeptidase
MATTVARALKVMLVPVTGGHLATYSYGRGPLVIFLHGGPGDTHSYLKRMAEPLFREFQCVFFDQRGTGGSTDFARDPENFGIELLFQDLNVVQRHFTDEPVLLVGHSWGAMYAFFASIRFPQSFEKIALLNMGPLDTEMEKATAAHLISVLNDSEKAEWSRLRHERNSSRDRGDLETVRAADKKMMHLRVKTWVFNPALHEEFLNDYFQDPPPDREVNKLILDGLKGWFDWDKVKSIPSQIWMCTGANDSVPIAQAEKVQALVSGAQLTVIDRCGHIPWLEHSEVFYAKLRGFLKS